MKVTFVLISSLCAVFILGIVIPKLAIHSAESISSEDIACAKRDTQQLLNPVERLLIMKVAVTGKKQERIHAALYAPFGLRYATVELTCNGGGVIRRSWRPRAS